MTDNMIHYLADEFRSHAELFKTLAAKLESKGVLEAIERDVVLDIFKKSYASILLFPVVDVTDKELIIEKMKDKKEEEQSDLFSTSELESVFSKPSGYEGIPFTEAKDDNFVLDIDFESEVVEDKVHIVEFQEEKLENTARIEIEIPSVEITEEIIKEQSPVKQSITRKTEKIIQDKKFDNQPVAEIIKQSVANKKSLAEQFTYPPALHEALANVLANQNLSAVLASRPIANLASGISLNDKFLFIRELFEGNNIMYEEVISQIDNSHSLSEAMHIVGRTVQNTDFESGAAHKFIEIIHRRFSGY